MLLGLVFREECLACKKPGSGLCQDCLAKLDKNMRETAVDVVALYDYRNQVVREAIWRLKYYNTRGLGKIFGRLLYENMVEDIFDLKFIAGSQPILVIPVPISKQKSRARNYNQAKIIARYFCAPVGKNNLALRTDIVERAIDTPPQARIVNRTARIKNIKGAFRLKNKNAVSGRVVIVIDDVTTTGATIGEIKKLLESAGAKKVVGFALAH